MDHHFSYSRHLYTKVVLLIILCTGWEIGMCQNLAPNWSFEQYDECPTTAGGLDPLPCIPWTHAGTGSPDYFNSCATGWPDVPNNGFGHQFPKTGEAYTGVWCRIDGFENYREYLMAQLATPMIVGNTYHVSFYVNLSNECCGGANMGAYFSLLPPLSNDWFPIPVTPQIAHPGGFISDTSEWTLILGCFTPSQPFRQITIGNFYDDDLTPIDTLCQLSTLHSYYYIEDVTVIRIPPGGVGQLELGPPVTACQSYTIESGITDVVYQWSTGSYQPSIDVMESGTYYLTVTGGCTIQIDSVEVTIADYIPFDLGQDEVNLCAGESHTITLDPNAGTYTWSDGFIGHEHTITQSGVYQVTLDNGCLHQDEISIHIVAPPEAPFLGPDTFLCPQTNYLISLDPTVGTFLWQDNSTLAQYNITAPGTYAVTISNACGSDNDEVVIDQEELPELNLDGDPILLCEGDMYTLTLNPMEGNYLWDDGSTSSTYIFSSPGFYSVTLSNECGADDGTILVLPVLPIDFSLGSDLFICASAFPYTFNPGDILHATEYDWGSGHTEQEIVFGGPGVYSLTVSNNCFEASDEIEVFFGPALPLVTLPEDTQICQGDTLLISLDGIFGDFLWQDSSTSNSIVVDTLGMYHVQVSNECGSGSDTIMVSFAQPISIPDLGPDVVLCPGDSIFLKPIINDVSFVWQDMSTRDSFLVTSPGTYAVTATGLCGSASDTVLVVLNDNPPVIDLPDQLSLCQGQTVIIDAGISGVSYLWNDGSTNSQITASSVGTYSLTVSNTCGTDRDTVIVLDGGPAPLVDLGNDINLCAGDIVALSPTYANVDSWLWHDGSTQPTYSVSAPGLITVQVTNNCGTSFDTLNATLLPAIPPLDLGQDTAICPGQSVVLNIATPNVNILWSNGSINPTVTISNPGLVSASISNVCGSSFDTINVSHLPAAPSLNLGPDQSLCPGELITIDPGISNVSYLWHDGSTATSYQTTQEETIFLTITNACGSDSDTLLIIENNMGPQVNLGPDVLACDGDIITISGGISGVTYLWQDGSTASNFVTSVSGEFILQVSNACGVDTDTIIVNIHGDIPVVDLGPDTSLCEGLTLLLTSNADAETSVQWHDGSSLNSFTVSAPGLYSLFESNHCGDATDTVLVSYIDAPDDFTLGPDTMLCPGEMIVLTAPASPFDLLWQDGSTLSEMIADQPLIYWLQISSACGIKSDSVIVDIDTRVLVLNLDTTIPWCAGDIITLDASQPFAADYLWSNGAVSTSIMVSSPSLYSVTVFTLCNELTQSVEIIPDTDCAALDVHNDIFIPNVFSPNGDGNNDVFTISYGADLDVVSIKGSIYDRWGNLVYSDNSISFVWDGRFGGTEVMSGVYVYMLKVTFQENGVEKDQTFAGDITLIR